ncbi:ComF family protein [Halioxenophilus aromaticivorans]|uniref:ComF family protein n=1 Tax=Halioxenophilus aromaticivorans TaxID=1306992 RepID=UPI0031EC412A
MDVTKEIKRLVAQQRRCLLCTTPSPGSALCTACNSELPRLSICCPRCALPLPQPAPLCGQCSQRPPPVNRSFARYEYRSPIDYLINQYKEHNHQPIRKWWLAEVNAEADHLSQQWPDELPWTAITPVPLHWRKQWRRGFNQAYEISRVLAQRWALPIVTAKRRLAGVDQKQLNKREREQNLEQAFVCSQDLGGHNILIVDDVVTTGATVNTLAGQLLEAGANTVDVFTLARTPKPSDK